MKVKDRISYYCFNKECHASIYFRKTVKVTELPITVKTLIVEHHCNVCHSKLVSVVDIELKQALSSAKNSSLLSAY